MSESEGSCQYVFDPDEPQTWGGKDGDECHIDEDVLNEDGVWSCPHDQAEDAELCVFHLPLEEKPRDLDLSEELVRQVNSVTAPDTEEEPSEAHKGLNEKVAQRDEAGRFPARQFIGARFSELSLSEEQLGDGPDADIYLSHIQVDGDVSLTEGTIKAHVRFQGARVDGSISVSEATFEKEAYFDGLIASGIYGKESQFERHALFREITCEGTLNFTGAVFEHTTLFSGAEIGGITRFTRAKFEAGVGFGRTVFQNQAIFSKAVFETEAPPLPSRASSRARQYGYAGGMYLGSVAVSFNETICNDRITFEQARITGVAIFLAAVFRRQERSRPITFEEAVFEERVIFGRDETSALDESDRPARFESHAGFTDTVFESDSWFEGAVFEHGATFTDASFGDEAVFSDATAKYFDMDQARVDGGLRFDNATIQEEVSLEHSTVREEINLNAAAVSEGVQLQEGTFADFLAEDAELSNSDFENADLTEAALQNTVLQDSNLESTFLSRAMLFGADLRGSKLFGAVLGDVQIDDNTQFLGQPSTANNSSPHTVSAIRSQPVCIYDPSYGGDTETVDIDKAKSVYRALEELAGRAARPRLQSQCFVRRQDLQKREYWSDATQSADTVEERVIAGARWSRAKVARATLLYGESPWRVIAGSTSFIVFIALLYPLGEWLQPVGDRPITYARIAEQPELFLESLYFSTLTFTTLGMGDYVPLGFGQVLATANTAFGAVLIALLVFVLGRRAAR
jgi:uncharacterized protein YjbI with pentapeptide repeats